MSRVRKNEYRKAAMERLKDAEKLREAKRYHAMVYLLGFVLECAFAYGYCEKRGTQYVEDAHDYNNSIWRDHNRLVEKLQALGREDLLQELNVLVGDWHVEMRYLGNKYVNQKQHEKAEKIFVSTLNIFRKMQQLSI